MFNPDFDESVDFEFFGGNCMNIYEKRNKIDSSKIVTKAVIETKPLQAVDIQKNVENASKLSGKPKENQVFENEQTHAYNGICLSSPSSSLEKVSLDDANLDSYLLNCLAYNDKIEDSDVDPLEGKFYSSDSSLSESSSITTLSSDFTSVSPVLTISDSSCLSDDESVENSILDNESKVERVENMEDEKVVMVHCEEIEQAVSDNDEELSQSNNSTSSIDDKIKSEISNGNETDCSDYIIDKNTNEEISEVEANISSLEGDLEDISLASQSRSTPSSKLQFCKGSSNFLVRKKEFNLTFSREELIKIERENLILLKKIMSHAKPRALSLNQSFNHKKTSAAINRARQQKKIEQDNYILYSKISALGRMKKVF